MVYFQFSATACHCKGGRIPSHSFRITELYSTEPLNSQDLVKMHQMDTDVQSIGHQPDLLEDHFTQHIPLQLSS